MTQGGVPLVSGPPPPPPSPPYFRPANVVLPRSLNLPPPFGFTQLPRQHSTTLSGKILIGAKLDSVCSLGFRDPVVFVNYIIWTVIHKFVATMPKKYRDAYDEYAVTMTGNKTSERWKDCIDKMQTVFSMPLGLLFVDAAFDEGSKETV